MEATEDIAHASKFFVVRLDEGNYFNIVYEFSPKGDKKRRLEEKCGRNKPAVFMYLCASVDWRKRNCKHQPLQMRMDAKASHSRLALHSRMSKHYQPVKLTEWINEKEVFFINCQKRSVLKPKGGYLCVYAAVDDELSIDSRTHTAEKDSGKEISERTEMDSAQQRIEPELSTPIRKQVEWDVKQNKSYRTRCEPNIKRHDDSNTFMLFRLLKPDSELQGIHKNVLYIAR